MENQTNQPNFENKSLGLADLFFVFKRNLLLIIGVTFLFVLCSSIYGFNYKPYTYTASATVMVKADSQSTSAGNYNDTVQSLRIMATVKDFITNDLVMEEVAKELAKKAGKDVTNEQNQGYINYIKSVVKSGLTLTSGEESLILKLSFSSNIETLDEKSGDIFVIDAINTVITEAQEVSKTTIETTDAEGNVKTEYKYSFVANNIQELSWAKTHSASRGATKLIIICAMIGAVIGYLIALLKYILDDTFRTKEELEEVTSIPVLAFIEEVQSTGGKR